MLHFFGRWRGYEQSQILALLGSVAVFAFFAILPTQYYSQGLDLVPLRGPVRREPRVRAANSTLGFEKLLVLSAKPSWRTRGLQAAAVLTGLDFVVPPQPHNPEAAVEAFEHLGEGTKTTPKHGSAMAWVGHLDMLKFVISAGFETALIVEDDVDWDVRIKRQTPLISDAVRNYTNTTTPEPYGMDWDVLWLGHCGAAIDDWSPAPLTYADPTRCRTDNYTAWSKKYLLEHLPEGRRQVQHSTMTVCSFAYGVTRTSAQKILGLLASGGDEAFDVALSNRCRANDLRCLVVNPQIMHHYEPPKDLGYVSSVDVGDGDGETSDETQFEFVKGVTRDIVASARCRALFNDTCMVPKPKPEPAPEPEASEEQ